MALCGLNDESDKPLGRGHLRVYGGTYQKFCV